MRKRHASQYANFGSLPKVPDYKPITQQALQLCGERPSDEESLVFEGLTDASWISRPLKVWIEGKHSNKCTF